MREWLICGARKIHIKLKDKTMLLKPGIIVVILLILSVLIGCNFSRYKSPSINISTDRKPLSSDINWQLVWSDEFDYKGLPDSSKWNYEVGSIRNNHAQYYTGSRYENARVENGQLIIEARKESYQNFNYTSASLMTKYKHSWLYGLIEVRAKIPTGRGIWTALWMVGSNIDEIGWPDCGEIDILEQVGFEPDKIYANVHTKSYNHELGNQKGTSLNVSNPHENYYVYAIEWSEDKIDFFVNEVKYFSYTNEGLGKDSWPFDEEQFIILSLSVGGSWGGSQGIDDSIFPQRLYIDYVRVYQKSNNKSK